MLQKVQYVRLSLLITVVMFAIAVAATHGTMRLPSPEKQGSLEKELDQARENLRISKASEERIGLDLERMRQSAATTAAVIQDYENYHQRMQALVRANQKRVIQLEALQQKYGTNRDGPANVKPIADDSGRHDPSIPEESVSDPVADLDRQLDQSLAAFDVALLKEMELIKIQSAEQIKELTDEMEAARQRLKDQGIDIDALDGQESDNRLEDQGAGNGDQDTQAASEAQPGTEDTAAAGEKPSPDTRQAETGSMTEGGSGKGVGGVSQEEKRRYGSGEDDDIVARQLREAAEKETDPELRKKLWQEYEDYKKNQ